MCSLLIFLYVQGCEGDWGAGLTFQSKLFCILPVHLHTLWNVHAKLMHLGFTNALKEEKHFTAVMVVGSQELYQIPHLENKTGRIKQNQKLQNKVRHTGDHSTPWSVGITARITERKKGCCCHWCWCPCCVYLFIFAIWSLLSSSSEKKSLFVIVQIQGPWGCNKQSKITQHKIIPHMGDSKYINVCIN